MINKRFVRGNGIRDIAAHTVFNHFVGNKTIPIPKQKHDDSLEIEEFWTDVQKKERNLWLVDAYHRETGEMGA